MSAWIFGVFLVAAVLLVESKELHEVMSPEEVHSLFHTTPDKIPPYEVTQIQHSIYKRSAQTDLKVKFRAFERDVEAYLNPNEGFLVGEDTPVWINECPKPLRRLRHNIMKEVLGIYQSRKGDAAVVIRVGHDAKLKFDGTVDELSVVPLPSRLQDEAKKADVVRREALGEGRMMMRTGYHVVFRTIRAADEGQTSEEPHDATPATVEAVTKKIKEESSKPTDKEVVFPAILVTTDFNLPVNSSDDSAYYEQIIYQVAFWNGVDLRFRELSNPKVRLRLAGLIIANERICVRHVYRNTYGEGNLNATLVNGEMADYYSQLRKNYSDIAETEFHVAVTMTSLNMYAYNITVWTRYGGIAMSQSLCQQVFASRVVQSIIMQDDRNFGGILIAAHELGHTMGLSHDEGTEEGCEAEGGYVMNNALSSNPNNLKWSRCSKERLSRMLRTENCADKLKDNLGEQLSKVLPGSLRTAEEQCKGRGYDYACEAKPGMCKSLSCYFGGWSGFFKNFRQCQYSYSAAEGTECAPGKVCLNGECRSLYPSESLEATTTSR